MRPRGAQAETASEERLEGWKNKQRRGAFSSHSFAYTEAARERLFVGDAQRETFARRWSVGEQHVEGDNTGGRSNVSLGIFLDPHSMREMKDISQELEWHMKEQQHEPAATDSGRVVSGVTIF